MFWKCLLILWLYLRCIEIISYIVGWFAFRARRYKNVKISKFYRALIKCYEVTSERLAADNGILFAVVVHLSGLYMLLSHPHHINTVLSILDEDEDSEQNEILEGN